MTPSSNGTGSGARSLLFAILSGLGISVILPSFLDTPLSSILFGVFPPFLLCLLMGFLLNATSGRVRWAPPLTGFVLSFLLIASLSLPPLIPLLFLTGAGFAVYFLERSRILSRAIGGSALAILFIAPIISRDSQGPRLLVLGIDAMDFRVVTDMMDSGLLPHIGRLMRQGAWGPLETEEPTFSPILWTTIASGKGPESHGVEGFYSTATHVRVPRFWDILAGKGWRVGLFRWLITWPPSEGTNGFWIPDFLARDDRTVPPEYGVLNEFRDLAKGHLIRSEQVVSMRELARYGGSFLRLGIRGSTLLSLARRMMANPSVLRNASDRYLLMRQAELAFNVDIFLGLLARYQPDLAVFYDNSIDLVGHRLWQYRGEIADDFPVHLVERYGTSVLSIYQWTDRSIGRIMKTMPDSARVAILSDHGQSGIGEDAKDFWIIKGDEVLAALGLDRAAYVTTLGPFSYLFPVEHGTREPVDSIVARELPRIRLGESGEPLIVLRSEPSTRSSYLDLSRAELTGGEAVTLDGRIVPISRFVTRYFVERGTHDRFGILLLAGPGIRPGTSLKGAGLRDFVPTLLHWNDFPIARDMEGKVILAAFAHHKEIRYTDSYNLESAGAHPQGVEVTPEVKDKLKAMGYVK